MSRETEPEVWGILTPYRETRGESREGSKMFYEMDRDLQIKP